MYRRCVLTLLAIAASTPLLPAQSRGVVFASVPSNPVADHGAVTSLFPHFPLRPFPHPTVVVGAPFLYPDYAYEPVVIPPAQPQVIVIQAAPAAPASEPSPTHALLIEWDGTRYVRSDSSTALAAQPVNPRPSTTVKQPSPNWSELRPVVLVFRDGQRQQVNEYTIADGILYAHGDYWTDGYWNRQIRLSSLNLPATFAVNQQNDVRFVLPTGPNEVITRP